MKKKSKLKLGSGNRCERLHQLAISETGFIFDPQTGQSFTVNQTGLFVLDGFKKGQDTDSVSHNLSEACGVPIELAQSSVEAFVLQLERYL